MSDKPKHERSHISAPAEEADPNTKNAVPAVTESVTTGTAVATYDFGSDAGAGMEDVGAEEYRIPMLRILQQMSPQCEPGAMEGAKPGMIMNIATNELYDGEKGFDFMPCHRDHNFVQWIHRDAGGGFVGVHEPDDPLVLQLRAKQGRFGKLSLDPNNLTANQIVEGYYLYSICYTPFGELRCIIPFASTQMKKYQTFMTRYMGIKYPSKSPAGADIMVNPPLWAHMWHLQTVFEANKKGKFYGWKLSLAKKNPDGTEAPARESFIKMSDPRYLEGREFYNLIKSGMAKADFAATGGDPDEGGGSAGDAGDEIPF